ncbi:MAG: hypothetical protein R3B45_13810 [Bdellovibrionota bacterium]
MTSDWHSLILAEASMQRLEKLDDLKWMRLDPNWFVPCAAQGALVIETLQNNPIINMLKTFDCTETRRDITIERLVLKKLGVTVPCHLAAILKPKMEN